jgi:hypothetical protein
MGVAPELGFGLWMDWVRGVGFDPSGRVDWASVARSVEDA